MNFKTMCSRFNANQRMSVKLLSLASAAVLCTSVAFAQMGNTTGNPAGSQQPTGPTGPRAGQRPMDSQANGGMTDSDNMGGMKGSVSMDKMFVRKALQGGMAEVELGQLALTKTNDPDIKAFAQKMVDDHTKMGEDMKAVAQQLGVPEPKRLSNKDTAVKAKLQGLNGAAFNKSYVKDMVKDHQEDERDFKHESEVGVTPAVKDAATKGEQIISMHLEMAKKLAQSNNVRASN